MDDMNNATLFLDKLNRDRAEQHLEALRISTILMETAQHYALMMANRDVLSHKDERLGNTTAAERMEAEGYPADGGGAWGEIILSGQPDWESAYTAWWKSAKHREVMLNADVTEIGVVVGVEPEWNGGPDVWQVGCAVFGAADTQGQRPDLPMVRVPPPYRAAPPPKTRFPGTRPPNRHKRKPQKRQEGRHNRKRG